MLHGGDEMDCLHLRHCSLNATGLSEIGKCLYAERRMPAPAIARPIHRLILYAILLQKACRQIR